MLTKAQLTMRFQEIESDFRTMYKNFADNFAEDFIRWVGLLDFYSIGSNGKHCVQVFRRQCFEWLFGR